MKQIILDVNQSYSPPCQGGARGGQCFNLNLPQPFLAKEGRLNLGFIFLMLGLMGISLFSNAQPNRNLSEPLPVPLPTKMRPWRYIVIHHTSSTVGNEEMIQSDHLHRGMENGMAYHFLIGNGSAKLDDGKVVEGHRWKYQLPGGHCHQDLLNDYGIGICLVGNFNRKAPTAKQMESLGQLVLRLQKEFIISDENIHGHGEYYGEDSDCPGRLFSWADFWIYLDNTYRASELADQKPLSTTTP